MALEVAAGDCFRLEIDGSIHWFFLISDPEKFPEKPVVLVPLTKISGDKCVDNSCLVTPSDHPRCKIPSYIEYKWAIKFTPHEMDRILQAPITRKHEAASSQLLERLRIGAEVSEELRDDIRLELYAQGIVKSF